MNSPIVYIDFNPLFMTAGSYLLLSRSVMNGCCPILFDPIV